MLFLRRSLTGVLLMALTAGLLGWAGHAVWTAVVAAMSDDPGGRPAREVVQAVNLVPVVPGVAVPVLETFGEIRSYRTLELRAAVEGRVLEVSDRFRNGGRVSAGELLLRLDPAEAEAALATARADLAEAEADRLDAVTGTGLAEDDLAVAREQADLRAQALARQEDLLARGVGSAAAVETAALAAAAERASVVSRRQALAAAEARMAQAEAGIERARIALAEAERLLADTEMRAGFDGVLSEVQVVAGGIVNRNEALARLVDPEALEVAFRLSTAQYLRLLDGGTRLRAAPVEVGGDGSGGLQASGHIDRESPTVGEGETGRLVYARLDTAAGLRPGDIVTVRVEEPVLENVARLPALAVSSAGSVLTPDAEMRLVEVAVEVARRQGDHVLVRAPDLEGAQVVAERTPALGAGIKVRALGRGGPQAASVAETDGEVMLSLTAERRARLVTFLREDGGGLPPEARERLLALMAQERVPADVVRRIETRMGS